MSSDAGRMRLWSDRDAPDASESDEDVSRKRIRNDSSVAAESSTTDSATTPPAHTHLSSAVMNTARQYSVPWGTMTIRPYPMQFGPHSLVESMSEPKFARLPSGVSPSQAPSAPPRVSGTAAPPARMPPQLQSFTFTQVPPSQSSGAPPRVPITAASPARMSPQLQPFTFTQFRDTSPGDTLLSDASSSAPTTSSSVSSSSQRRAAPKRSKRRKGMPMVSKSPSQNALSASRSLSPPSVPRPSYSAQPVAGTSDSANNAFPTTSQTLPLGPSQAFSPADFGYLVDFMGLQKHGMMDDLHREYDELLQLRPDSGRTRQYMEPEQPQSESLTKKLHRARLQQIVHKHVQRLLGIEDLSSEDLRRAFSNPMFGQQDSSVNSASSTDVWTYNFRVLPSQDFNRDAVETFITDLMVKMQKDHWYRYYGVPASDIDRDAVRPLVLNYLDWLRRQYRECQGAETQSTPHDSSSRAKIPTEQSQERIQKAKQRLYKARKETVEAQPSLVSHLGILKRITAAAMSCDEIDNVDAAKRTRRSRISPAWRSLSLQSFLWLIDDIRSRASERIQGGRGRRGRGREQRLHTDKVDMSSKPPSGLPRNCYNKEWLHRLSPRELAKLDIEDRDYAFPPAAAEAGLFEKTRRSSH